MKFLRLTLLFVSASIPAGPVFADVPELIHMQGRLVDGGGTVNGNVALVLRLFDADTAGTLLYADSNSVAVTDGLYATSLGDDTISGSLATALTNTQIFLEVEADGVTLSPREQVTSVAYALMASGVTSGAITSDMLADASVTTEKLADGSVTAQDLAAGAVTTSNLAVGAVTATHLADQAVTSEKLLTKSTQRTSRIIPNPSPSPGDEFGSPMALLGDGRIAIGVPGEDQGTNTDSGAVHLFESSGTLLATINNPTPSPFDLFGSSVSAVGSNRFVVGAPRADVGADDSGVAHLFLSDGTFLFAVTNPTPNLFDNYGTAVAGVGIDRFVVGAPRDGGVGVAHLYEADGTWVASITNTIPSNSPRFGQTISRIGPAQFAVGAPSHNNFSGAVHMHGTDGNFLYALADPTPDNPANGQFGSTIAELGPDLFAVGVPLTDLPGGPAYYDVGEAHLYQFDGTPFLTITNPVPHKEDEFGFSIVALGSDVLAIGAPGDFGSDPDDPGVVYLYSTNGMLLDTVPSPAASGGDLFGRSLLVLDSDRWLAGAPGVDIGQADVGSAYVMSAGPAFQSGDVHLVSENSIGLVELDTLTLDDRYVNRFGDTMAGELTIDEDGGALHFQGGGDRDLSWDLNEDLRLGVRFSSGVFLERMRIDSDGNVGVGTTSPEDLLHIWGGSAGEVAAHSNARLVVEDDVNAYMNFLTPTNTERGLLFGDSESNIRGAMIFNNGATEDGFQLRTGGNNTRMVLTSAGSVGIGIVQPADKLHVNGGNIRVSNGSFIDDGTTLNVPDYVFEPGYSLLKLSELKAYIDEHGHLPKVPNRDEVRADGLNMSEFQMRLLEKIEELTLYTLEQQRLIEEQAEKIELMNHEIHELHETGVAERIVPAEHLE